MTVTTSENPTLRDNPHHKDGLLYFYGIPDEYSERTGPAVLDILSGKIIFLKGLDGDNQRYIGHGDRHPNLLCITDVPENVEQKYVYLQNCKGCITGILRYKFDSDRKLIEGPVEPDIVNN